MLLAPEKDPLAEDVHRHDLLHADRGPHALPLAGESLAGLDVELVLVLEAAEQPPATARDLRGVEREVLVLGEREIDRPQLGEPGGAAVLPATAPDAGEAGGLVADPDLPQLDAGAEERGEIADQCPEIDPLLGGEVDGELVPVPLPLGVAHLHHEPVVADPLDHLPADLLLGAAAFLVAADVVGGGAADDRLERLFGGGLGRCRTRRSSSPRTSSGPWSRWP